MLQNTLNGMLGFVVIAIAFSGLSGLVLIWTLAILGLAIAGIGLWGTFPRSKKIRYSEIQYI